MPTYTEAIPYETPSLASNTSPVLSSGMRVTRLSPHLPKTRVLVDRDANLRLSPRKRIDVETKIVSRGETRSPGFSDIPAFEDESKEYTNASGNNSNAQAGGRGHDAASLTFTTQRGRKRAIHELKDNDIDQSGRAAQSRASHHGLAESNMPRLDAFAVESAPTMIRTAASDQPGGGADEVHWSSQSTLADASVSGGSPNHKVPAATTPSIRSDGSSVGSCRSSHVDALRLRLRLARFKLDTHQINLPISELSIPERLKSPKPQLHIQELPFPRLKTSALRKQRPRYSMPERTLNRSESYSSSAQEHARRALLSPVKLQATPRLSDERHSVVLPRLSRIASVPTFASREKSLSASPEVYGKRLQDFDPPSLPPPDEPELTSSAVKDRAANTLLLFGGSAVRLER